MEIKHKQVTVRELAEGYQDNREGGVIGFGGKLDIRPPYQREFVYNDKQRKAVIDTLIKGFPLNTMYWAVTENGYEIIDGQQRTISICQYLDSVFSYKRDGDDSERYFHNLQKDEKDAILNYKLTVYLCEGVASEKLDWFRTINIAGATLTDQELRNAVYAGSWTADAKRYFSKTQCAASQLAEKYMSGTAIRQDYLETAIRWISDNRIEQYMATNQHSSSAADLWIYFQSVINWLQTLFPKYRREMKGLEWGLLYNQYKNNKHDPKELELSVTRLMMDDDVTGKRGIYQYLLSGDERHLNIRSFKDSEKRSMYERQEGICPVCTLDFPIEQMQGDHVTPWSEGGKTEVANGQMLCKDCNRRKSNK